MKIKALSVCIAAGFVCGQVMADTTVYGKMNVTIGALDTQTISSGAAVTAEDNWQQNSNASRIGIKGETKINDTLKAVYMAEYEVGIDDGVADDKSGDEFKARNIYVGLQGDFGTVLVGNHDTPLKMAQGKVDQFNDLPLGDIKNVFVGENRVGNVLAYVTPDLGGLSITAAFIPGESNSDDTVADTISANVQYTGIKNLRLAVAVDSDAANTDTVRVVGEYKVGDLSLGALYQDADSADSGSINKIDGPLKELGMSFDEQESFLFSGAYKIDNIVLKAQYATSESQNTMGSADTTQIAVGVDYILAKSTKVFTYYSDIEVDAGNLGVDDLDNNTFVVGLEHKF